MIKFSERIINNYCEVVGCYSGFICYSADSVFESMGFVNDPQFIKMWMDRISGGLRFPCGVLSRIDIDKPFENVGYGSNGIKIFNNKASNFGALMSIARIVWEGDPVDEKMSKNLYFYQKNGWFMIPRINDYEHYLAYYCY